MRPSRRSAAVVALATALAAFPLGALASHQFADVPDSNPFHADISAIADAGVTSGCGGGNYCPSANVTREQMAAFMNRLGALGAGKTPVVNADKLDGLESGQFVRSDVPATRRASCGGTTMEPTISGVDYGVYNGTRVLNTGTGVKFNCTLSLPDGATVTEFRAGLSDTSATEDFTCNLARVRLGMQDTDGMANVFTATAPGDIVLGDVTVGNAVIDNETYWYEASCTFGGNGNDLLLRGVSVVYSTSP